MELERYVAAMAAEADRCAALLRTVDHAAPVPHLPGWTVGHVAAHLAGDFRWATRIMTTRAGTGSGLSPVRQTGPALCAEFDRQAAAMLDAMRAAAAEPDAPCPNFAERTGGRLGWWVRHQAHETTLHRWDLEVPTGGHASLDPELAADGVDELFSVYTARYGPHELAGPLTVRCLGVDAGWRITPTGRRGRVRIDPVAGLDRADVEGEPAALLLTFWRRLGPDQAGVTIHDRPAAVRAFLAGPLTA